MEATIRIERLRWDAHRGKFRQTGECVECPPAILEALRPWQGQATRRSLAAWRGDIPPSHWITSSACTRMDVVEQPA
jgi:hypothetical protein